MSSVNKIHQYLINSEEWGPADNVDLNQYKNEVSRLKAIVNSQPDCVKIVSKDYKLIEMNSAGLEFIDADSIEQVKGISVFDLVDSEYHYIFKNSIDAAYAGKKSDVEFNITGLKGTKRRVSQHSAPIFNKEFPSDVIEIVAVTRDITSQFDDLVALEEAKILAEQANTMKSTFLATMSHEFRTPLNAIIGFSEIINEESFGSLNHPKYKEYIKDIHKSGRHLLDIINDVLDISEIEANKRVIIRENVNIKEAAYQCTRTLKVIAAKRDIELEVLISENLPALFADLRSIKQILINLLSNAIKFSHNCSKVVLIVERENRNHIKILVKDTGLGIAKKALNDITKPFFRGEEEVMISVPGTGLGLSIVNSLVEVHGGTLTIDSIEHMGTTVSVLLPIQER